MAKTDNEWTPDATLTLRQLWAEGLSMSQIGKRMNRTKNGIMGKVHRLGLGGRPSPIQHSATPKRRRVPGQLGPTRAMPVGAGLKIAPVRTRPLGHFHECQWIDGDVKVRGWRFCGKPTNGESWCAEHRARVFARTQPMAAD